MTDPQHAQHGVQAALTAAARIHQACEAAEARGECGFRVKIGLNSGLAVVGNVGTTKRYNYTAVGEMVNIAVRLEGVPELYACQVVVAPGTAVLVQDIFLLCELDTIQVKGHDAPLTIYEPLVLCCHATAAQYAYVAGFVTALYHYRSRQFAEAATMWEASARHRSDVFPDLPAAVKPGQNPAAVMAQRACMLTQCPPGPTWSGEWALQHK